LVLDAVNELVEPLKIAVLAIDGPVHGARRSDSKDGVEVRREFRDLWSRGGEVDSMVEDWMAALDEVSSRPEIDAARIAWYGISMGTAYGIPVVASDARIRAAVLGMWGTCRKPSERLEKDAVNVQTKLVHEECVTADSGVLSGITQNQKFGGLYMIGECLIYVEKKQNHE
jgi:dienelactone hydrolase